MQNNIHTKLISGLIAAFCVVGTVETLEATPEGSQRLRGLGDRVFAVHVTELTGNIGPLEFDNCYFFEADGTWIDPGFLDPSFIVPGTWGQDSNGANTSYGASAGFDIFRLEQEGMVTPAHGAGTLQLEAYSTFFIEGQAFLEFLSVGNEVEDCPF